MSESLPINNKASITASELNQWGYCHYSWFNSQYRPDLINKTHLNRQTEIGTSIHKDREIEGNRIKKISKNNTVLIVFCLCLLTYLLWNHTLILSSIFLLTFSLYYFLFHKPKGKLKINGRISNIEETLKTNIFNTTLVGKPDRVDYIKTENQIIPVDYKSGNMPKFLYKSVKLQMLAYIYLLEQNSPLLTVPYGKVIYLGNNGECIVENDDKNKKFFQDAIKKISNIKADSKPIQKTVVDSLGRGHKSSNKCTKCSCFEKCEYKLTNNKGPIS